MRRSRFTEERIVRIPRETRGGGKVKDVCARHNVSERTCYGWKRRDGGMEVDEPRQARAMAEENTRLKTRHRRSGASDRHSENGERKKVVSPAAKRRAVKHVVDSGLCGPAPAPPRFGTGTLRVLPRAGEVS